MTYDLSVLFRIYVSYAWKGMLDGGNFVKSGWVHSLKLHQFKGSDGWNFVIMGKVYPGCG